MNKINLRHIDLNLLLVFDVLMAERNVTRAASRLARTQSAVSHALARLRTQLGDPLLIKTGGRMQASPFAERLVADVRPLLADLGRVLAPAPVFDAATSQRRFRVALPDLNDALFPALAARVLRETPLASLEYAPRDSGTLQAVAEGGIDLALIPAALALPDDIGWVEVKPSRWASFVRKRHPAIRAWSKAAWSKWPHVAVRTDAQSPGPVVAAALQSAERRRVAVWVPHFAAVAPLLARTDLIATLPVSVMYDRIRHFGLQALRAPIRIEPMRHRLVWSRRLENDPGLRWLRGQVEAVFTEVIDAADAAMPG